MRDALVKLEHNQERIVDIIAEQSRQNEALGNLRKEVDVLFTERRRLSEAIKVCNDRSNRRLWDVFVAFLLITGTAVATYIVSR